MARRQGGQERVDVSKFVNRLAAAGTAACADAAAKPAASAPNELVLASEAVKAFEARS
jgi:hypothetical protein